MSKSVVVRYAPSPTGSLHLGGLRTALFNFLHARKYNGRFLLRIEDTDQKRIIPGAAESLMTTLTQCGVRWDNPEVAFQSKRKEIYTEYANTLIDQSNAYRCFCSSDRLAELKSRDGQKYDRFCLSLTASEIETKLESRTPHVVRFLASLGPVTVNDTLRGKILFPHGVNDDQILVKSDGMPTYHLASVVDDHLMGVTHVIRGEEWLPSTPKHLALYQAFGWSPPLFTHLPLLLNADGSKLSKRQGDVGVEDYLKKGYLPSAIVNFVALLGWSPSGKSIDDILNDDGEEKRSDGVLDFAELVENFDLTNANKSGAIVDLARLNYINGRHIERILHGDCGEESLSTLIESVSGLIEQDISLSSPELNHAYLQKVMKALASRVQVVHDFPRLCSHFFLEYPNLESETAQKMKEDVWHLQASDFLKTVKILLEKLDETEWNETTIKKTLNKACKIHGVEKQQAQLMMPLRFVLTGLPVGAAMSTTIFLLGKDGTLNRLRKHSTGNAIG